MNWAGSPGGTAVILAAIGMALLAGVAWRRRSETGTAWLALVLLAAAGWALAYSLELVSTSASLRQLWGDAKYVGICALPPAWVMFVAAYTGRTHWGHRRATLLLAVEPVLVLGLLASSHTHDWIRYYPTAAARVAAPGVLFWPHSVYTYLVLWTATGMLVVRLARLSPILRRQAYALVAILTVPFVCNLLYNLAGPPFNQLDLTPFAFLGVGVVLVGYVLRFHPVGLRPVPRSHAFEQIIEPALLLDPRCRVIDLNAAAAAVMGEQPARLIGRDIQSLVPGVTCSAQTPRRSPREETLGGRTYEVHLSALTDRRDRPMATLLVARDITDYKLLAHRLARRELHDQLTGAANRALFFDRLKQALESALRTGHPVAVAVIDLDAFKAVNDRLGHVLGDSVLVAFAERIAAKLRNDETLARLGGDEFAILIEDAVEAARPLRVAALVQDSLSTPLSVQGHRVTVSASVGIATGLALDADDLVREAEADLYRAKANLERR